MKKILLIIILMSIGSFLGFSNSLTEGNCYYEYNEIFERRGATNPKNGNHKGVVITIRKEGYVECYYGKVKVSNGRLNLYEIYLTFEDGTEEKLTRTYKNKVTSTEIVGGVSVTVVTKTEELINVFFIKNILPKKKKFKKASPIDLGLK